MSEDNTSTSEQVQQVTPAPIANAKPYDDDMLEAYESEDAQEVPSEEAEEAPTETKELKPEADEENTEEEIPPGERKGDKVEDNFEQVLIKKEINGKEVEFKVSDAIQAFVKQEEFNRNMDKRITHISKREKAWQADQEGFKGKIGKVLEITQAGDFVGGIRALAKLAAGSSGLDITEFEKKYFSQLDNIRDVYTKMTPEQRETYFAKRKAEESEARLRKLEEEKSVQTETSQLQSRVAEIQNQLKIPEDEFWGNYQILAKEDVGEGKRFRSAEDIRPEDVARHVLNVRHEQKVLDAATEFGIKDDTILDAISDMAATIPGITVDEIKKVIKDSGLGVNARPEVVENLNRKVGKNGARFSQASSAKKNEIPEGYDEDTLNDLYRKQPKSYTRIVR